jgi:hypothetical protein
LSSGRHGEVVRGSTLCDPETPLLGDLADLLYCGIAFLFCLEKHLLKMPLFIKSLIIKIFKEKVYIFLI